MSLARRFELRPQPSQSDSSVEATCLKLGDSQLIVSRTAFITSLTVCTIITFISLLGVAILLYRERRRRRQIRDAQQWGCQSDVRNRISMLRKEVDDSFRKQYSGCLVNVVENPEMGSDSPVELMLPDRVWEAPTRPATVRQKPRRDHVGSLFFDHAAGLWMPKRR